MTGVYADTSNIVDGQQIDAADVKTPIDALDTALDDYATGDTARAFTGFFMENNDTSNLTFRSYGGGADIYLGRAQGTVASPTDLTASGSTIGSIKGAGYFGGFPNLAAGEIRFITDGTHTSTSRPITIDFYTVITGATTASRVLRMKQDRYLQLENAAVTPGTPTSAVYIWSDTAALKIKGGSAVTTTIDDGISTASLTTTAAVTVGTALNITGDLNHDGSNVGFYGTTPAARSTGWTTFTNLTTDKTCDANATSVAELADILGTLIEALKTIGVIAA